MYMEGARKITGNLRQLVLESIFEPVSDYKCYLTAFFFGVSKSVRLVGSNLLVTKSIKFLNSHVHLHTFSCSLLVPFLRIYVCMWTCTYTCYTQVEMFPVQLSFASRIIAIIYYAKYDYPVQIKTVNKSINLLCNLFYYFL